MFGKMGFKSDFNDVDDETELEQFGPPQRLTWVDCLIAGILGLFTVALTYALSYKGLHPDAWSECVVAAGVRTPESLLPGFWMPCARAVFTHFGLSHGLVVLTFLGKVVLGAVVALAYLFFKEILAIVIRIVEPKKRLWAPILSRIVCALTAVLFLSSDPVWSLGAYFSPALLEAFLVSLTFFLLALFLCHGSLQPLHWGMFLIGFLGAETPIGFFVLGGFWTLFYVLRNHGRISHVKLLRPSLQQRSKWYLTFFWGAGLFIGIACNIISFKMSGGMALAGLTPSDLPLEYLSSLWGLFRNAASAGAWIVGVSGVAIACLLALSLLRRATDIEYFLSYHVGILYFIIGCLAYAQVSSLHPLWFWRLGDMFVVTSKPLLFLCMLAVSLVILCALAVMVINTFCRDNRRLASQFDTDLEEELLKHQHRNYSMFSLLGCLAVMVVLLAGTLPGRRQPKTIEALKLIDDYVREVVTECGDAKFLFSDGQYDCAVELEAARRGKAIACIAVQPAEFARRGKALTSLMMDAEDRTSATIGGANVLRTWQRDKPDRMDASAVQVGLEIWRQTSEKDSYPFVSGVAARTYWPDAEGKSPDEASIARGIGAARDLSGRILEFYQAGGLSGKIAPSVRNMFLFMQWRLARMARIRAKVFGFKLQLDLSREESTMADRLDERNESLQRIQKAMARMGELMMHQMTPREGLRIALIRADYSQAHRCAEAILDSTPNDPEAHFGIGMNYLLLGQYNLAEDHLRACLESRPGDATIWNNLAELRFRQASATKGETPRDEKNRRQHYTDALEYARKALVLSPKSRRSNRTREVIDTLVKIKNALESDYDPDTDEELLIDVDAEMALAKEKIRELKDALFPGYYDPASDAALTEADIDTITDLTKRLLRLSAEANISAQASKEAEEMKAERLKAQAEAGKKKGE